MKVDPEVLANYCIGAAAMLSVGLTMIYWGDWLVLVGLWLLLFPAAAWIFGLLLGYVLNAFGATMDGQVWMNEAVIVERSPEIIGKLNGTPIYEWVLLQRPDNGELVKCLYEKTMDPDVEWDLPEHQWFVMENGVLYAAEPTEEPVTIPDPE